jgi:peptidoglycan hydrolase-like protein with peptidoglycan-binding domain
VVSLFGGNEEEPHATYRLAVGHLDPSDQISGVQARLTNLGYYRGPINGQLDQPTRQAISSFRASVLHDDSNEMDGALLEALDAKHGA